MLDSGGMIEEQPNIHVGNIVEECDARMVSREPMLITKNKN